MSKLRSVSTALWSDPWIESLTPNQKLLFLYLITNEKTNMLGIYESSVKKISFETGIPEATVTKDLKAFESLGKVRYMKNFVILTNFIKHQNYNPNMKKAAVTIYNDLPQDVKIQGLILDISKPSEAFESLCKGLGMVRKVEVEVEVESEEESKPEDETKKKIYRLAVDYWLKDFHVDWTFGPMQGKALKSLLKKIEGLSQDKSEAGILNLFKTYCQKLPDWFKDKDLPVLDSKFNEIVEQIKNPSNGKSGKQVNSNQSDKMQQIADEIARREALQ